MKESEIKVKFVISDFECDPKDITNILGISPTKIWRKGDNVHPKSANKHKQNGWSLSASLSGGFKSLGEQIDSILEKLLPCVSKLNSLPSNCEFELSCVVYIYNNVPELNITASHIKQLSEIRCSIDFDIYMLE